MVYFWQLFQQQSLPTSNFKFIPPIINSLFHALNSAETPDKSVLVTFKELNRTQLAIEAGSK